MRNKYRAVRIGDFPSKLEYAVHEILLERERAKEISDIKRQVRVELTKAAIATKIDFSFLERSTNEIVYCEAKGMEQDRWKLLKRLWAFYGPGKLEVWGGSWNRPRIKEIIEVSQ
jgi:hypothetical protein